MEPTPQRNEKDYSDSINQTRIKPDGPDCLFDEGSDSGASWSPSKAHPAARRASPWRAACPQQENTETPEHQGRLIDEGEKDIRPQNVGNHAGDDGTTPP
jgi:hypothetical protein